MNNKTENTYAFHLGIAEKGKLFAVSGNYREALRYYKEAIKLTENQENGALFFQHYIQCVMEAMELMGSYDEVISYCEKFLGLLHEQIADEQLRKKYIAEVQQRIAIQYLLKEDKAAAKELLLIIQAAVGKGKLALSDELLNWILRGYTISKKQIVELQNKYKYFIVSKEKLKPELAIELPEIINHL